MKEPSQDFIDQEETNERQPVEIFHIWEDGGDEWFYTSGDVSFDYDGDTYEVATIDRGAIRYNSQLEAQTMKLKVSYLQEATLKFLSINPVRKLWVSCMKLHRAQATPEASVVFLGQIKKVLFKGLKADVQCVGFEHFLKKTIPTWRYQFNCNHTVFDDKCNLTKASYLTNTIVTLDSTGLIISSADFGLQADGYFTGGEVVFGNEARTIVAHEGNDCTLIYRFTEDIDGQSVDAYPGCDGRAETCRDKYANINNFLGFSFIPTENPALRVSW